MRFTRRVCVGQSQDFSATVDFVNTQFRPSTCRGKIKFMTLSTPYHGSSKLFQIGIKLLDSANWLAIDDGLLAQLAENDTSWQHNPTIPCRRTGHRGRARCWPPIGPGTFRASIGAMPKAVCWIGRNEL